MKTTKRTSTSNKKIRVFRVHAHRTTRTRFIYLERCRQQTYGRSQYDNHIHHNLLYTSEPVQPGKICSKTSTYSATVRTKRDVFRNEASPPRVIRAVFGSRRKSRTRFSSYDFAVKLRQPDASFPTRSIPATKFAPQRVDDTFQSRDTLVGGTSGVPDSYGRLNYV